ncbi:MAG TPA: ergothioneine biosynthesis protein EgtB [Steroidobacteraceae bacterium]
MFELLPIEEIDTRVDGEDLRRRFDQVRQRSCALSVPLSDADASVQSMPDASPAKWHLAHTTWFFESFILSEFVAGYRPFDDRFALLFNSYYEAKGARISRFSRGLLTRPSLDEIRHYRAHVDAVLRDVLGELPAAAAELVELGCQHEEQHQELLLTDVLHLFSQNPLAPAVWCAKSHPVGSDPGPLRWIEGAQGAVSIGAEAAGFAFDCERPRHTVWLAPHCLADRLVTNGEWQRFMEDKGYQRPELWLSDGWAWIRDNAIKAPLHWRSDASERGSFQFGLDGLRSLDLASPVTHISYFEADAYARWCGARLPTEAEWEQAACNRPCSEGVFLDEATAVRPYPAREEPGLRQLFGDAWEWTASAYLPYPGFRTAPGAVGEYNGKFMSGQFVLRGGSCATPRGHARASYRNFFYPHQRWQFTGVRLARDLA